MSRYRDHPGRDGIGTNRLLIFCWSFAFVLIVVGVTLLKLAPSAYTPLFTTGIVFVGLPGAFLLATSYWTSCYGSKFFVSFLLILLKLPFMVCWYFVGFYVRIILFILVTCWQKWLAGAKFVTYRTPPLTYFWQHYTFQLPRFGWHSLSGHISLQLEDVVDNDHCKTSQLCSQCLRIVDRSGLLVGSSKILTPRVEYHTWLVHLRGVDLYGSEQVSCHMCNILWCSLPVQFREQIVSGNNFGSQMINPLPSGSELGVSDSSDPKVEQVVQINVQIWEDLEGNWYDDHHRFMKVCTLEHIPSPQRVSISQETLHGQNPSIEVPSWTGAPSCIKLAQEWIEGCCATHPSCHQPAPPTQFLPTRLVFVGSKASPELRLCTPSQGDEIVYLALSHCWGRVPIEKLTLENEKSWFKHIDFETLPANFQDAVQFTRGIGQKYVWIDSLCIIQNCQQDWEREAVKMSSVYAEAYCTISASGSNEAGGGCFKSRNPLMKFPCNILFSDNDALVIKATEYTPDESFSAEVDNSPLSKRAWAFQERLLSNRIVHFGANLLFFECGVHFASELLKEGEEFGTKMEKAPTTPIFWDWLSVLLPQWSQGGQTRSLSFAITSSQYHAVTGYRAAFNTLRENESRTTHDQYLGLKSHKQWFELVRMFTSAELTNNSDRLIAIYGIAKGIQEPTEPPNYVAGLWCTYIQYDLLWYINCKPRARPSSRRAPSWSWGSVDGEVSENLLSPTSNDAEEVNTNIMLVEICDIHMEDSSPGASGGHIDLVCTSLLSVEKIVNRRSMRRLPIEIHGHRRVHDTRFTPDVIPLHPTEDCFYAELVRNCIYHQKSKTWSLWSHGIIVRPLSIGESENQPARYERLGRAWAEWQIPDEHVSFYRDVSDQSNSVEHFLEALSNDGRGPFGEGEPQKIRLV